MATFTWFGGSGNGDVRTNWVPSVGPPQSGDTAIINSGTVQVTDGQFNSNTLLLNAGTFQVFNTLETVSSSSFDSNTTLVAGTSGGAALDIFGGFLNDGTIEAVASTVTVAIGADIHAGATIAGTLVNDGLIAVQSGATLDVTGGSGDAFQGGTVDVKGATAVITATDSGSDYTLDNGGTLGLDSASSGDAVNFSGTADVLRLYSIALSSTIDIDGFASGDTLDIGAETIGTIIYQSPQSGGAPVLTILNTTGGTILSDPLTNTNGGLVGNTSGTFVVSTLPDGVVAAGPFQIVTAGNGDTLLERLPPSAWQWTDADPTNLKDPNNFVLVSGPGNQSDTIVSGGTYGLPTSGDTIFANNATFALPSNTTVNGNTIFLTGFSEMLFVGTQAVIGGADTGGMPNISYQNPTVDPTSYISNDPLPPSTTTLSFAGYNVNEGTLISNAGPGSRFTIDVTQNGTAPGYFINCGEIEAAPHNVVIIAVTGTSELFNANLIYANGGTVLITSGPNGIAGGYAPMAGGVGLIGDGGTFAVDTGFPSGTKGSNPVFAFYDGDSGDTLKLDDIAQFGGRILGFQQGDTIDLGGALNVGSIAVTADGRVMLETPRGTVLATLVLSSGSYSTGTFAVTAVSPGVLVADGFTLTTGSDGNAQLTTSVVNSVWNDISGSWQTAGDWSTGVVPGPTSTAVIGANVTASADGTISPFVLTTGNAPVTIDSLSEVNSNATLQITSDTTVGTSTNLYGIQQIAGEIEITGGNTLTSTFLKQSSPGADLQVDPGAVLAIAGHSNLGFANDGTLSEFIVVNGTTFANGNSIGLFVIGTATVDGGAIDAGPVVLNGTNVVSSGGLIAIGIDGGGTPASMTVENGGTVIDTYADLSSDPSSFGALTLTGAGTTWDDAGDPTDTYNTRGYMLVGSDNQSGNQPSPSPAGTAQLVVADDATLNEANWAEIGQSADSAGSATITSGGIWNIGTSGADGGTGGFLNVGNSGSGTLDIDGGTVNVLAGSGMFTEDGSIVTGAQGMAIAHQAGSDGTVVVWGGGELNITISPTLSGAGFGVGQVGQGELDIYDGGTVTVTDGGISAGSSPTGVGTIVVGGTSGTEGTPGLNALLVVAGDTLSGGMSIGKSSTGTLFVNTGGTVEVSDGAINVGNSAGAYGFAEVNGGLVEDTTNGLNVGNAGTGTLELINSGTISLNGGGINVGESLGAQGLLEIASGGMLTSATNGMNVGLNAGSSGTLAVLAGGIYNVSTHGISAGVSAGAAGTILVDGIGALINIGGETAGNGFSIGQGGVGFLTVQSNGTVSDAGASITVGQNVGSTGSVEVQSGGLIKTSGTIGITVGGQGSGLLTIGSGGTVAAGNFFNIAQGGTTGSGSVVVNGGTLDDKGIFNVGNVGSGMLVVEGGGVVDQTGIDFNVGGGVGGQGVVAVDGGTLVAGDGMLVGGPGTGTLDVETAGTVTLTSGALSVGVSPSGSGTVQVSGVGALINAQGGVTLGGAGLGVLSIGGGGEVDAGTGFVDIGDQPGGTGSAAVGAGGTLLAGNLMVAAFLSGTSSGILTIATGGSVDTGSLTEGSGGAITVNGRLAAGAQGIQIGQSGSGLPAVMAVSGVVSDSGFLTVGDSGAGALVVQGGTVDLTGGSGFVVGMNSGGSGAVTVDGGILNAGSSGVTLGNVSGSTGAVSVESGGSFSAGNIAVGGGTAGGTAVGALTVSGAGSKLTALGEMEVGQGGTGNLLIENQATVITGSSTLVSGFDVGTDAGASGAVSVIGTGSLLDNVGELVIGDAGLGSLSIQSGGTVVTSPGSVAGLAGATIANTAAASGSSASVTGTNSNWHVTGSLVVGNAGFGQLSLSQGATVAAGTLDMGAAATGDGVVSVVGTTTALTLTGDLTVGDQSTGELTILSGAHLNAANANIGGAGASSPSSVDIEGTGSEMNLTGSLAIGLNGPAVFTLGLNTTLVLSGNVLTGPNGTFNQSGTVDPPNIINDGVTNLQGGAVDIADISVENSGVYTVKNGTATIYTPLVTFDPDPTTDQGNTNGTWELNNGGTLVLNATTVDASQAILFNSLNAELVIGQQPDASNGTLTGTVSPGAANVLPGFQAPIENYKLGDKIVFAGLSYASDTLDGNTVTLWSGPGGTGDDLGSLSFLKSNGVSADTTGAGLAALQIAAETLCFLPGTLLATPSGQTEVERLAVGDLVRTVGGQDRPIVWIGVGRVLATRGRRNAATPVIVRKGALAPNVPHADLRVTKGHSLLLDGMLIPVEFLVNHRTILWDDRAQEVSVYHIELETHDVLLANGAAAESYRDDGNRWLFQNANSGWGLPPQVPYAPVVTGGAVVDAVWWRLLDRAGARPLVPLTDDPDLHLVVDGVRVDAVRVPEAAAGGVGDDVYVFALRGTPGDVRVVSRAAVPQELGVARDARCLGVAVRRVAVRQGTRFRVVRAGDRALGRGFYPLEAGARLRWTDGDAVLPGAMFAGFGGTFEVMVHVGGTTRYVEDGARRRAVG